MLFHATRPQIAHLGAYESGGAGRAMTRIIDAIKKQDISDMFAISLRKPTSSPYLSRVITGLQKHSSRVASRGLYRSVNPSLHSIALARTGIAQSLKNASVDLVHLHWLGDSTLSIEEIGQISSPIVWTMHDMWAFCGAEHHTETSRHRDGYRKSNRPLGENGPDINRWTWERKRKSWHRPFFAVSPSHWLAEEARRSSLAADWEISVIPNPINADFWRPSNRQSTRQRLGLAPSDIFLFFGAKGGLADQNKGGPDVPVIAGALANDLKTANVVVGVAGQPQRTPEIPGVRFKSFGHISDDLLLRDYYSAADFTIVPSQIDNFPSMIAETMACGTPAAAYNRYGPAEMIIGSVNGVLSALRDPIELGKAIGETWNRGPASRQTMRLFARNHVLSHWNPEKVGQRYLALYQRVIQSM